MLEEVGERGLIGGQADSAGIPSRGSVLVSPTHPEVSQGPGPGVFDNRTRQGCSGGYEVRHQGMSPPTTTVFFQKMVYAKIVKREPSSSSSYTAV